MDTSSHPYGTLMHSRYLACPSYRHTPTSTHIDLTCIRDPAHKWGTGQSLVSSHRPSADTGPVPQNPALLQDPLCSLRDAPLTRHPASTDPTQTGEPQERKAPFTHTWRPSAPRVPPNTSYSCSERQLPSDAPSEPLAAPPRALSSAVTVTFLPIRLPANSSSSVPSPNTQPVSTGAGPGQCPGAGPAVGSPGSGGGLPGT